MDINSIKNALQKAVKLSEEKKLGTANQRMFIDGGSMSIDKHEIKATKNSVLLFPKVLQFPFNPLDPSDINFSSNNLFTAECACSTFIRLLKEEMNKNASLKEFYANDLGVTVEEYDTSSPDTITSMDFKEFNKYTTIYHFSKYVVKTKCPQDGKFGDTFLAPYDYSISEDTGRVEFDFKNLLGDFFNIERSVITERVAEIRKNRSKNELNSDEQIQIKNLYKSGAVSYPSLKGITVFIELFAEIDEEESEVKIFKNKLNPVDNLEDNLRWMSCASDELIKIDAHLHRKDRDTHIDFLPLIIAYNTARSDSDLAEELQLYKGRAYELPKAVQPEEVIKLTGISQTTSAPEYLFNFNKEKCEETIRGIFDRGLEGKFNKCLSSLYTFRPKADKVIVKKLSTRLPEIKDYITRETFAEYGEVIANSNMEVYKELEEKKNNGTLRIAYENAEEMSKEVIDEVKGDIKALNVIEEDLEDIPEIKDVPVDIEDAVVEA